MKLAMDVLPDTTPAKKFQALIDDATSIVNDAHTTKCTACLLKGSAGKDTLENLRSQVKAEIKELRGHNVKEAEVLHTLVYQRVQRALALKS